MLTLEDTGRLVGGFAWVELRLFEVVGSRATEVPEPEVAATLAVHARRHAARGEAWLGHRPVVAGWDADALVTAPTAGATAALDALASGEGSSIDLLAGYYRAVMPRLVVTYAGQVDAVSPVADPALRRSLERAAADAADDWSHGERLLQGLLASPGAAQGAARAQAQVESLLGGGFTA